MDEEEAALKAKLDATDDINERLELRKQIRELRNRKFDEELKKISSGEASSSKLTNDINSRKSIRRTEPTESDGSDPYGLLAYTTEQSLQDLLNDTPYTETDKRRKIRARMRDIRNGDIETAVTPTPPPTRVARQPEPEPEPEPVRRKPRSPSPEPVRLTRKPRTPSPEPVREPTPEPVREPTPEPVREPTPEPVREPTPEPVREPSPSPVPSPEPEREPSPEPEMRSNRYEEDEESGNEYEQEEEDQSSPRSERTEPSAVVEKVLQTAEPGIKDGSDFKDRLKKRQNAHAPLSLERPLATEGEQVDFRNSLKRKGEAPAVNLERKIEGPGQLDFRNVLARKVEAPVKDDVPTGAEQVDFTTALKKKVDKPVVDKQPVPAAQVDFRKNLVKKVQTRTIEDKNLNCEQKDFRVVLGKAPPSPKTGRRPKVIKSQESVDRTQEDLEKDLYVPPTDMSSVDESMSPEPAIETFREDNQQNETRENGDDARSNFVRKASKKAPPPPPKKKVVQQEESEFQREFPQRVVQRDTEETEESPVVDSRSEEPVDTQQEKFRSQPKEDSDDEVDGSVRNRQIARAERARRRQEKEAAKTAKEPVAAPTAAPVASKQEEENNSEEQTYRRTRRPQDSPATDAGRSERSSRRTRRLKALDDGPAEDAKPVATETKKEEVEKKVNGHSEPAKMNGVNGKHEDEEPEVEEEVKEPEPEPEPTKEEVVTETNTEDDPPHVNGNGKSDDSEETQISRDRSSRKKKQEEEREEAKENVSSDLLAAIKKPSEPEPIKKSIDSQLRANKAAASPRANLTGRAAEREAERLKREAEREERAAQRAKEREEAARKRKEQKEAFEKKMAEQKKAREMKQRANVTKLGSSTRNSMKAFKEKLESNSPAPSSPSPINPQPNSNLTKLLGWARKRTKGYEGVNVENFHDSWADGLAFAALIHSFCPDLIPIDELDKTTRRRNFELAFAVAKDEGVMDLLDVEDMVSMRSPDPKSVMTYVHSVYTTFTEAS